LKHSKARARLGLVLLTLLLALAACQAQPRTQDEVPRIAPSVLKNRLDSGDNILVVDARSADEYAQEHIAGAISVPLSDLEARMSELPRDQEIVFYCTWPAEQTSARAALILYQNGYKDVWALQGGLAAWVNAGYPLEP
jgi:rhodanese-related sulfurtransferase